MFYPVTMFLVLSLLTNLNTAMPFDMVPLTYEQMDRSYYPLHLWYAFGEPPGPLFQSAQQKRSHFDPIMFRKRIPTSFQNQPDRILA
ncbi:uncharacterized protein DEA37_0009069 [Paragonimus westermani]|uniref:Uncharacterized protein n=1 Tax=Paragonimus westermani TaxID=34504 RepID=A0A5J4NT79_9TREM|nr:uncharacterized protein DEA37_0009069 [Paragonimus westermani]